MELVALFLALLAVTLAVIVVLYLLCYICLFDTDIVLALAEKFGRPVAVYRGKVIWITGASSGLGAAMAYELASVGAKLILTARNETRLAQVKEKCLEVAQGKLEANDVLVLPFDITDYGIHKTKVSDVLNHFGMIDVLVNNAGRAQVGWTENTEIEVAKDIFGVNFFGAMSLTKPVLKHFLDRGTGQIVVITSKYAKFGCPGLALYSATKHALHGYFDALRAEHQEDGIDVTTVCPSFFESEIASGTMGSKKDEIISDVGRCPVEIPSSRCAHLALIAAANHLYEVWIAYQPFLLLTWCAQYMPDLLKYLSASIIYSKSRREEACAGKFPSDFKVRKPFFS